MKRLFTFTLTFILCFTTTFSSACFSKVKEIEVQLSDRFTQGEIARCVWDLYVFDGKIYMGSGDYDKNTGPTDICAYDLKSKTIEITGTVRDEAIISFVEIDGILYAPGTDPKDNLPISDYYSLTENGWTNHTALPNIAHNFDLIKFDGVLYAGVGGDYGFGPILSSTDNGKTFDFIPLYKNGEEVAPLQEPDFSRCYDFYTLNGKLHALIYHNYTDGYQFEIYRLEDGKMQFYSTVETINFFGRTSVKMLNAKAEYNGKIYLSSDKLYSSNDGKTFENVALPNNEWVSDFFIIEDTMYILSFLPIKDGFSVKIYSLDLVEGTFNNLSTFNYPVPPLSFVKVNKNFYIGMGNRTAKHEKNGALLKVRP